MGAAPLPKHLHGHKPPSINPIPYYVSCVRVLLIFRGAARGVETILFAAPLWQQTPLCERTPRCLSNPRLFYKTAPATLYDNNKEYSENYLSLNARYFRPARHCQSGVRN